MDEVLAAQDVRRLADEALEVLAMRACKCRNHAGYLTAPDQLGRYTCLAHQAIAELERRERAVAQRG